MRQPDKYDKLREANETNKKSLSATHKEIEEQLYEAQESLDSSRFPAMTYEEGVQAALTWVLGIVQDKPMED